MVTAQQIMTKDVQTVHPDTPISLAVKVLVTWKITGLPVIDQEQNIVGIISEKDMLGLLLHQENVDKKTVADFMTKDVKCFAPEDSAMKVCEFLSTTPYRRVPIVEGKKLVGIVSRADIIRLIWKERWDKKK